MSFVSEKELNKKIAAQEKKKHDKVRLSDETPKKLLQIAKSRIDAAFAPLEKLIGELEQKRNSISSEIAALEISQKNVPDDQKKSLITMWDFIEKRCRRKPDESEAKHKKRVKNITELVDSFIEEHFFSGDKTGRIVSWLKAKSLFELDFFELGGGRFTDAGKAAKASQEEQWSDILQKSIGKKIFACIVATDEIKELVSKLIVLAAQHDVDTDRQESYFARLYNQLAKDLLFGPLKDKQKSATTESTKANKKRKSADSDYEDEDEAELTDDEASDVSDEDGGSSSDESGEESSQQTSDQGEEDEKPKQSNKKQKKDEEHTATVAAAVVETNGHEQKQVSELEHSVVVAQEVAEHEPLPKTEPETTTTAEPVQDEKPVSNEMKLDEQPAVSNEVKTE